MDPNTRGKNKPAGDKKPTPPKGWGDSEHDTRLHRTIKPHGGPHEINPEWGYCKEE